MKTGGGGGGGGLNDDIEMILSELIIYYCNNFERKNETDFVAFSNDFG